jgi:glycosyltransferase involved in cell wall biosynthesis
MIDHGFLADDSIFYKPLRWLERRINQAADVVLPSSLHAAQLLAEKFGLPGAGIIPIPDCVNADTFCVDNFSAEEKLELKQKLGIPLDKKVIVYLGVLTTYQGIEKLLEAVVLLNKTRNDFHLLLMGYPGVVRYSALTKKLGIDRNVTFTNKIPYDLASRYLALGDVATAPKISATEGSGKILNYMAMALPTVAFNVPVSREFLGDGGIYPTEFTGKALAAALNRALDLSADERTRLGQYLRQRAIQHFSWHWAGEQIESVYRALLAGQPLPLREPQRAGVATRSLPEKL